MKSFADLIKDGTVKDIAATTYCCKRISIDEITDKPITILNVIKDIKTEKGEGARWYTSPATAQARANSSQTPPFSKRNLPKSPPTASRLSPRW